MKLIDMKRPKPSKKELKKMNEPVDMEAERYPWGTRLNLDAEEIAKIPALKKAKVGDEFRISAVGKVVSTNESKREGDKKRQNVEIQIQKIGFANKNSAEEAFNE